jgi:hypothetical protein
MALYSVARILAQDIPDDLLMEIAYRWQSNDNRKVSWFTLAGHSDLALAIDGEAAVDAFDALEVEPQMMVAAF